MESSEAVAALASLAQESRLAVFRLLVRTGPEGMPAGAIAETLEIPSATLSFHLGHLSQSGLVTKRRDGRSIIYALSAVGMRELMAFLAEDCCQGRAELCAPGTGGLPHELRMKRKDPGRSSTRAVRARRRT